MQIDEAQDDMYSIEITFITLRFWGFLYLFWRFFVCKKMKKILVAVEEEAEEGQFKYYNNKKVCSLHVLLQLSQHQHPSKVNALNESYIKTL